MNLGSEQRGTFSQETLVLEKLQKKIIVIFFTRNFNGAPNTPLKILSKMEVRPAVPGLHLSLKG